MTFQLTFCNELLAAEYPRLADQSRVARKLGAMGLEVDPASLGPEAHRLSSEKVRALRDEVEGEGIRITGLHWLLSGYPEASITDPARQAATQSILFGLIDLAHGLGADVMVHGSPKQRVPVPGADLQDTLTAFFAPVAKHAQQAGLIYCIEPLSRTETTAINTVAEGAALCGAIGNVPDDDRHIRGRPDRTSRCRSDQTMGRAGTDRAHSLQRYEPGCTRRWK